LPLAADASKKEIVNGPIVVPDVALSGTRKPPVVRLLSFSWFTIAWPVGGAESAMPASEIVTG
jgi:hypothetical protein